MGRVTLPASADVMCPATAAVSQTLPVQSSASLGSVSACGVAAAAGSRNAGTVIKGSEARSHAEPGPKSDCTRAPIAGLGPTTQPNATSATMLDGSSTSILERIAAVAFSATTKDKAPAATWSGEPAGVGEEQEEAAGGVPVEEERRIIVLHVRLAVGADRRIARIARKHAHELRCGKHAEVEIIISSPPPSISSRSSIDLALRC